MVVTRGLLKVENGEFVSMSAEVQFGRMKMFYRWIVMFVIQQLPNAIEVYT
jgi:hypothetical protein